MKRRRMSAMLVFVTLMVLVSEARGIEHLTINGEDVDSINLTVGQSCTIEVVSSGGTLPYIRRLDPTNFSLSDLELIEIRPEAGAGASVTTVGDTEYQLTAGTGMVDGVHFVFSYTATGIGQKDVELRNILGGDPIDSIVINVTPAPAGTAFTYQGRLMDANGPADGKYDFEFRLFQDSVLNSFQVGATIDINDLDVIDGYFTVLLDFGNNAFTGDARWLEVGFKPWDSEERCTILSPRHEVTPTPYAIYAENASTDNDWMISGNDMYSIPSGKIGIGTTTPGSSLEVISPVDTHSIRATSNFIPVFALRTAPTGTWPAVEGDCNSLYNGAAGIRGKILSTTPGSLSAGVYGYNSGEGTNGVGVRGHHVGSGTGVYGQCDNGYGGYFVGAKNYFGGNVGIGTTSPRTDLEVLGTTGLRVTTGDHSNVFGDFKHAYSGGLIINANAGGGWADMSLQTDGTTRMFIESGGNVGIGTIGNPPERLTVRGNILVQSVSTGASVAEIGEGLDYAEGFNVTEDADIKAGTVLVIDSDNPGKLTVSRSAYDSKVAGIVAGAKGLGSGVRLGIGQFDHDVALAGRVYCNVDATEQAVQAGDLLTTSTTPGYAMKATDYDRARGAILGKAMQKLQQGQKGQILVLVTLQ